MQFLRDNYPHGQTRVEELEKEHGSDFLASDTRLAYGLLTETV